MEKFENYNFTKEDFELCQNDNILKDKKIETLPTSFFKDAFKRFRKNKSSLVATCIIGTMLLLTLFVPLLSPYEVSGSLPHQTLLPAKLFSSGTGFWDGTTKYTNIVYDTSSEEVIGFNNNAIVDGTLNLSNVGDYFSNTAMQGVMGGTLIVSNDGSFDYVTASNYHAFTTNVNSYDIKFSVDFEEVTDTNVYGELAEFRIILVTNTTSSEEYRETVVLQDWSKNTTDVTINLSDKVKDAGLSQINNSKVYFEVKKGSGEKEPAYIGVNSFEFTSDAVEGSSFATTLSELSMLDANAKILEGSRQSDNSFLPGYWQTDNTSFQLYKGDVIYASFTYDAYDAVFGIKENQIIDHFTFIEYIQKGWIKYDYAVGIESFEVLSDECPIVEINSFNIIGNASLGYFYEFNCDVHMYSYYGYTSMPSFIFGTDAAGHDLFTKVFSGLSLSLLLAITVGAFCITFGIIWGAISGYYGGQIDIYMERFIDVFARIPSVVLIPLLLALIGQNLFSLAVVFCLMSWMGIAGLTRTQFYRYKGREYVLASRTLGAKDRRLIFKHILPNAAGLIITNAVMFIPGVISMETTVAYYGLGLTSSNTLGVIMSANQSAINYQPLLILFPAALFSLLLISFNLFGNGLRDAFNTSLRGSE